MHWGGSKKPSEAWSATVFPFNKTYNDFCYFYPCIDAGTQVTGTWKASDGSMWYRKYSDGWIEQGGLILKESDDTQFYCSVTINFPIPFTKTTYSFSAQAYYPKNTGTYLDRNAWTVNVGEKGKTSIRNNNFV